MYKSSNIVAAISGIVISIGTLSTTASATPKSFFIEGQIVASNKKEKLREKAKGFADKAQEYAEEAEEKAEEAEDCCRNTKGAPLAQEYAEEARVAAESAEEKAEKAVNTNKTSRAKDLKNKAKDFASLAEKAAENAERALNLAIEEEKEKLIRNAPGQIEGLNAFIKSEKELVNSAKECCSNQEVYPNKAIEDVEESAEVSIEIASEAISAFENVQAAKSLADMKEFWNKGFLLKKNVSKQGLKTFSKMKYAKSYPDDFSDLKGECAFNKYEKNGKIGYEVYGKRDRSKKVRYDGFDWEKFMKKYC